jgi:hypothetical protein
VFAAKGYYTNPNKEDSRFIYDETIIAFTTQQSIVNEAYVNRNKPVFDNIEKKLYAIVMDEIDILSAMIPSIGYITSELSIELFSDEKDKANTITKNSAINWIEKNYTSQDARNISKNVSVYKFYLAQWLTNAQKKRTKIIIATSELLPIHLLRTSGFIQITMGEDKLEDIKQHTIRCIKTSGLNKDFFQYMNKHDEWKRFEGYDTVITDRYDSPLTPINQISHVKARGKNDLIGKNILSIVAHIPRTHIKMITDGINQFIRDYNETQGRDSRYAKELLTEIDVKNLFYRDRICQAVGRVIGFRGLVTGNTTTDMIVHQDILDDIQSSTIDIKMYYNIEEYPKEIFDLNEILDDIYKSKEEHKKQEKQRLEQQRKDKARIKAEKAKEEQAREDIRLRYELGKLFEHCPDYKLFDTEISKITSDHSIMFFNDPIWPKRVAEIMGAEYKQTSVKVNGKPVTAHISIGLKPKSYRIGIRSNNKGRIREYKDCWTLDELFETQLEHPTVFAHTQKKIRDYKHFDCIEFLQFDFDAVGYNPEQVSSRMQDIQHYIMSSESDNPTEDVRYFHLYAHVANITSPEQYKHALNDFVDAYEIYEIDHKAKDAVRYFGKHQKLIVNNMHVDKKFLYSEYIPKPISPKQEYRNSSLETIDIDRFISNYDKKNNKNYNLIDDGNRWLSMQSIAGVLLFKNTSTLDIITYIDRKANYRKEGENGYFTRSKVVSYINSLKIKHKTI